MTKQQVIEQFCRLSTEVGEHFHHHHAHDCFCMERRNFAFSEEILNFIVRAVQEKIDKGE
jgi:hypothetical protein